MVTQEQRNDTHKGLCVALGKYVAILEEDLGTQYDNHPDWSEEDEVFLVENIERIKKFQQQIGCDICTELYGRSS